MDAYNDDDDDDANNIIPESMQLKPCMINSNLKDAVVRACVRACVIISRESE